MNKLETGEEAGHVRSNSQKELAKVLQQRAAISAVLRAIANSPHDLQPIFDTIVERAVDLCRAGVGGFRLSEEAGFRLVASKRSPVGVRDVSAVNSGTRGRYSSPLRNQIARPHPRLSHRF